MTHKEAVLLHIQKMDTGMLHELLFDRNRYHKLKKEIFLDRLNDVFQKWKNKGDTEIILEKGQCECEKCQQTNMAGYTLIGNMSKSYLDLMFKVEHDTVSTIYQCRSYREVDDLVVANEFIRENSELFLSERFEIKRPENTGHSNSELENDPLQSNFNSWACDRCLKYGKCLGLNDIEDSAWDVLEIILEKQELSSELVASIKLNYKVDLSSLLKNTEVIQAAE